MFRSPCCTTLSKIGTSVQWLLRPSFESSNCLEQIGASLLATILSTHKKAGRRIDCSRRSGAYVRGAASAMSNRSSYLRGAPGVLIVPTSNEHSTDYTYYCNHHLNAWTVHFPGAVPAYCSRTVRYECQNTVPRPVALVTPSLRGQALTGTRAVVCMALRFRCSPRSRKCSYSRSPVVG